MALIRHQHYPHGHPHPHENHDHQKPDHGHDHQIHLGENLLAQAKAPAPRRATPPVATAAMLEKGLGDFL